MFVRDRRGRLENSLAAKHLAERSSFFQGCSSMLNIGPQYHAVYSRSSSGVNNLNGRVRLKSRRSFQRRRGCPLPVAAVNAVLCEVGVYRAIQKPILSTFGVNSDDFVMAQSGSIGAFHLWLVRDLRRDALVRVTTRCPNPTPACSACPRLSAIYCSESWRHSDHPIGA